MNRETAIPVEEAIEELAPKRRFRPYPDYRDSGIEWLGHIPNAWDLKRLKHVTKCLDGKRVPLNAEQRGGMQGDYPYWGANGILDAVDDWLFDEPLVLLGEDGAPFFEAYKDVAFSVNGKIWVNNHAHVLRSTDIVPGFLAHYLNTVNYSSYIEGTTRDKLVQGKMKEIPVARPPQAEQRAIAAFLDRETARLDELIAKKQRLIELLAEKRTALISHAVTKGLNPDAPMKDSGIEWLGRVPAHWSLLKLGYITTMQGGGTPSKDNLDYWNGSIPWVSPKDMKRRIIDDSADHVTDDAVSETTIRLIDAPAVLVVVRGMILSHSFPVGLTSVPVTINQDMKAISVRPRTSADFLAYLLQGIAPAFLALVEESGHGTKCLRTDLWKGLELFMPPIEEQNEISEHLRIASAKHDGLMGTIESAIERLREYRSALISAAVTGKIDVRELDQGGAA